MKRIFILFMLSLVSFLIVGCKDKEPEVKLEIDTADISLSVGETHEIDYTLTKGYDLEWTVSKTGVINVNKGKIEALASGNVVITVKVKNAKIEKQIKVAVSEVEVESVEISGAAEGIIGDVINLTATILPANATNKTVTWISNNTEIATVTNGKVSLLEIGEVVITAQVGTKLDTFKITVLERPVSSIEITGDSVGIVGDNISLSALVLPENATNKTVTWSSSNLDKAEINANGLVTLKEKGKVIITATAGEVSTTFVITINEIEVTSITVIGHTEGYTGDTITLVTEVHPYNATNRTVTFTSSNENVATVDQNGVVSLKAKGTVVITAKAGSKEDSITITVNQVLIGVTDVKINGNTEGKVGETITLTTVITPENATDKTIIWTSNNETVATVNANGVVTLLKAGTVVISAKAQDVEDTLTITVTEKVENDVAFIGEVGYTSLEKALDAANSGDTISLMTGSYDKDFTISKSNLTFTSVEGQKAVIKGKITLSGGLTGLTFTNLEFTGKGQIYTGGTLDDFTFTNNKVYDSTIAATAYAPNNRTDVNAFIQLFTMTGTNIIGNVTITNNTFVNMPSDIISISRTTPNKTVNISNNEFRKFGVGAIRFDGGYNSGTYLLNNNLFENETLSGYNAILFRAYSPSSGNVQDIYIENNTFRNIGVAASLPADTYPGSAVIATSTFNDNLTNIYIRYNLFDNCVQNIHLRNVTDSPQNWKAYVNYNEFRGAIGYIYNEVKDLADLKHNLYIDSDGNPIVDDTVLKTLIINNTKYNDFYDSEINYIIDKVSPLYSTTTLFVKAELAGTEAGTTVKVNDVDYIFGTTIFSSIKDAVAVAKSGDVIYVMSGNYADSFTINVSNLAIISGNSNVDPNLETRAAEAVVTGVITIAKDLKNITFNGLKFEGDAQVVAASEAGIDTFVFKYNVVSSNLLYANVSTPVGVLKFVSTSDTAKNKNIILTNNYFTYTNASAPRALLGSNIENLYVAKNVFESSYDSFTDIIRITGTNLDNQKGTGLTGKLYVFENDFKNAGQCGLFITKYGSLDAKIIANNFEGIITSMARFRFTDETTPVSKFVFNFNKIELNTKPSDYPVAGLRIENAALGTLVTANYNHFTTIPSNSYFIMPTNVVIDAKYNFYGGEQDFIPAQSRMQNVDDYSEYYTQLSDLPTYGSKLVILPTDITVSNPISELNQFEEYKLEVSVTPTNATNSKVEFSSSDTNIATVDTSGNVYAVGFGDVTITIKSKADPNVVTTITFTVNAEKRVALDFVGSTAVEAGKTLQLNGLVFGSTNTITWSTSDASIATVNESGLITAVSKGNVTITAKIDEEDSASIDLVIYGVDELNALLSFLVENSIGVTSYSDIVYIGSDDGSKDYLHKVYGSVSYYRFNNLETIKRDMLSTTAPNYSGQEMSKIEWVVIHDTAGSTSGSTAAANSGWNNNPTNTGTSWHYTIGNDGIFQQLEDNIVGWHAGDGTKVPLTFTKTEVLSTGYFPTVTISEDGYFVINDIKTTVLAPTVNGAIAKNSDINDNGIRAVVGSDGYYYLPNTRYTESYGGNIAMYGGNLNGIGIETAVNSGSDVWLTWQMTAKLSAKLLIEHDLAIDRLVTHNHFSGKPCPRTMMTAGKLGDFLKMAVAEYTILKDYADYKISFVSHNPELLDNTGKIIGKPLYTTNVSYTITVTDASNNSQSITLNSLVPGSLY